MIKTITSIEREILLAQESTYTTHGVFKIMGPESLLDLPIITTHTQGVERRHKSYLVTMKGKNMEIQAFQDVARFGNLINHQIQAQRDRRYGDQEFLCTYSRGKWTKLLF